LIQGSQDTGTGFAALGSVLGHRVFARHDPETKALYSGQYNSGVPVLIVSRRTRRATT
jgi:hypothetical protein